MEGAMQVTLNIPDELAGRLRRLQLSEDQLRRVLELGLQKWNTAQPSEFAGVADVLETLARLPTPEEVLALRPAAALQARLQTLLEKNRTAGLLPEEEREWEQYQYLEHLVRLAKAQAALKRKAP